MPDDLAKRSVKDLRQIAAGLGIAGRSGLKKAELLAAITAARTAAPDLAPSAAPAGSSATAATPAPVADGEAAPGLPVPDRYGVNTLTLMVQDPTHIFAYWEVTPESLADARRALGEAGMPVLLVYSAFGQEQRLVDLDGGSYYLCISPDTAYRADIGLRGSDGRVHVLASSETVRSPRNTISGRRDETWMGVDESFHELLGIAGLDGAPGGSSGLVAGGAGRAAITLGNNPSSHSLSSASLQRKPPGAP